MASSQTYFQASEEAAQDLDRLLSVLGESSLTRDRFVDILKASASSTNEAQLAAIFDRLLLMCREAETRAAIAIPGIGATLGAGGINGNCLRCLYTHHPAYTTCLNPMDTAFNLTTLIHGLFVDSKNAGEGSSSRGGVIRSNSLTRDEAGRLLKRLSWRLGEEKKDDEGSIQQAVNQLLELHDSGKLDDSGDHSKEDSLDLETVASSLLRYTLPSTEINPSSLFSGTVSPKIFDPFQVSARQFVGDIDATVLSHDAVNHHVLTSFALGSYGGLPGTLTCLADFMDAYRCFTSTFCTHLANTIAMVGEQDEAAKEILEENMEEEQGIYHDEDIEMIIELGLDAKQLEGVPHKELYVTCRDDLRKISQTVEGAISRARLSTEQCRHIAAPMVSAFNAACDPSNGATAATAMAAMYFGSELLVSTMYKKLSSFLVTLAKEEDCVVTRQDLAFFILHIDMDVDHADKMRDIVISLVGDHETRVRVASVVDAILKARVEFFDLFVEAVFPPVGHGGVDSAKLYNKQSQNWVRKGATCLSDFTGRPVVFDMCSPYVVDGHVLDVGCGEGYGARKLVGMGAKQVLGFDVSKEMIERANANPSKSDCETYDVCDATKLVDKLNQSPAALHVVPGRMLQRGCFDLAVAIFLFNYTTISQMKDICSQIYKLLKPGGHFVFSVPHPFMLNAHGECETSEACDKGMPSTFSFSKGDAKADSYFSLRDRKFAGVIRTLDGRDLNVKMSFKAVSDYVETMNSVGFNIAKMHEARVLPEHVAAHPEFFASVRDSPLHMVFDVVKPVAETTRIPRAIKWTAYEKILSNAVIDFPFPRDVVTELMDFAIAKHDEGETEDSYRSCDEDRARLGKVADFAKQIRARLQHQTGAVRITGLDLDHLASGVEDQKAVGRAKFAYFILSSLIGKVDGSARGALFDVIDKGLDTKADNVLFSVSDSEAPWHTDGASADKAYDCVGLLCISPASVGGTLHLSNAAAALDSLQAKLPKFIVNELLRPIPRDILENGNGQGVSNGDLLRFSRSPDLLPLRVQHNAFPIFDVGSHGNNFVRFRYMRQWIESGHMKSNLPISPLLEVAMDALDGALDQEKLCSTKMAAGDIVYCNNASIAHARDGFRQLSGEAARHKVRVWIQLPDHS